MAIRGELGMHIDANLTIHMLDFQLNPSFRPC
jgi:hypothetical protein